MSSRRAPSRRSARRRIGPSPSMLGAIGAMALAALGVWLVVQTITDVRVGTTADDQPLAVTSATSTEDAYIYPLPEDDAPAQTADPTPPPPSPEASRPSVAPGRKATLELRVLRGTSLLTVRVPDGPILFNGVAVTGRRLVFSEARMQVVVGNSGAVQVMVNGVERKRAGLGVREVFVVSG